MGIISSGTRALLANQMALQTAGNNIANVNTPGYSRQRVIMETVEGQFTGGGYIGNGVNVQTIQRNFSEFLTRQSTLATSTQSADATRSTYLKQLEGLFETGPNGLGASINEMLNAFSDVVTAPTDLTARTVVLTRIDETAARMRATSLRLDDLQRGIGQELTQKVSAINSITKNIAGVNGEITRALGNGQPPNDLLDRRDQLIRELNEFVQTSSVASDDGSISLFIAGSQSLVLGTNSTDLTLTTDDFGDTLKNKLSISNYGRTILLDENMLAGGEVSGLLRFQNNDLVEGRNLLGRLTLAVTTSMNTQHQLGLDLDGVAGGNLFSPIAFGAQNILEPKAPAVLNTGNAVVNLAINDTTKFVASDYAINFTSASTGSITRSSDGAVTLFDLAVTDPVQIDGLSISLTPATTPNAGDRFLLKPFSTSANNISRVFSTPRALAVASPVAATMATTNTGSLQQVALVARSNPVSATPVVLTFTGPNSYTRSDEIPANTTVFTYTPGQAIEGTTPTTTPLTEWSLTLQGTPKAGDTLAVRQNPYPKLNAGNASAMLGLRDVAMFDGGALTDGYAGLVSQIGIRTQSANYAAEVSTAIAANLERDRAGVSGVNLDEEAAKLLQFQQSYQACAKMLQIAQNVFDTLIQGLNR